jgi:hypothetical protein
VSTFNQKRRKKTHNFEEKFLKELENLSSQPDNDDECDAFGQEVARELRTYFKNPYDRAMMMKFIRDEIFRRKFPSSQQASTFSQPYPMESSHSGQPTQVTSVSLQPTTSSFRSSEPTTFTDLLREAHNLQ